MPASPFITHAPDIFVQLTESVPLPSLVVDADGNMVVANSLLHAQIAGDPVAILDQHVPTWRLALGAPAQPLADLYLAGNDDQPHVYTLDVQSLPVRAAQPAHFVIRFVERLAAKEQLITTLGQAVAACFDTEGEAQFFAALEQTCSTLPVSAALLRHEHGSTYAGWVHLPTDQAAQLLIEHGGGSVALGRCLAQAVHSGMRQRPDAQPHLVTLALDDQANLPFEHMLQRDLLALHWGAHCLAIPLHTTETAGATLLIAAPGLRADDAAGCVALGTLLRSAHSQKFVQTASRAERAAAAQLVHASRALATATSLDDVVRVTCRHALQLTGGTTAALLMPEPDSPMIRCHMALGSGSDTLLGQCATLHDVALADVLQDSRHILLDDGGAAQHDTLLAQRLIPGIFQPLLVQQRTLGWIAVAHANIQQISPYRFDALEQFSGNAAVAIENAYLHETIRRSEERYRTLFQNAFEIILTIDTEGRILAWNSAALRFLGVSPAELVAEARNLYDLVAPEAADQLRRLQHETLHGNSMPIELALQRANGSALIVEVSMQIVYEAGRPSGVSIVGRDMTEHHRQQQALADQVTQLRALHLLSMALSTSLDRSTTLRQATAAIAEASQFEYVSIFLPDPRHGDLRLMAITGVDAHGEQVIATTPTTGLLYQQWNDMQPHIVSTQVLGPALHTLFVQMNVAEHACLPLSTSEGALGALIVGRAGNAAFAQSELRVLQTMVRQIAQALHNIALYDQVEHSAARYRDLYENANDFIGTLSMDGRINSLNHAALMFFGYPAAALQQLHLADLLPPEQQDSVQEVLRHFVQPTTPTHELDVQRSDGSRATLEIRSRLVQSHDEPNTIHFIARDLTERRKLEIHARQTEKLASLGQLVAGAAHELNNPLAIVIGTTQLLRHDPAAAGFTDDIRNIETAAHRAKQVVSHMLTFAHEHSDPFEAVDLGRLTEQAVTRQALRVQQAQAQLVLTIADALPPIAGDAQQLEQVLDHVLHNAVQAVAERSQPPRTITIAVGAVENFVQVTVSDNGPGIAPDVLPRIFDPFFTTREVGQGTGLGLSLVYGVIEKHGGTVRAESVYGHGATFVLQLPVQPSTNPARLTSASEPSNSSILVVEDEPDVRMIVERALTQHGYVVEAVNNAEAAIDRVTSKRYDLLITDMRMPGMTGKDLFDRIHQLHPQIKWVFITGDTVSAQSEEIQRRGVPFLVKPFTLDELWNAVATSMVATQAA